MRLHYIFISAALSLMACGGTDNHEGHDHEHEGHDHASEEAHGHEGHDHGEEEGHGDEIIIEPENAKKFGIEVTQVAPVEFNDVIAVSGSLEAPATDQATVAAKTAGILHLNNSVTLGSKVSSGASLGSVTAQHVQGADQSAAARAEMTAAKQEMDRLKPLADEGIVSKREYNAAVAAYNTAKARLGVVNVSPGISSPISGTITQVLAQDGQYVDVGTPIAVVTKGTKKMTLKANVPERYAQEIPSITTAKFSPAYTNDVFSVEEMGGKLSSASLNAGTTTKGYIPVYFTFDASETSLVPGGFAEVYLIGSGKNSTLTVPVSALTEAQGIKYVYVKIDDEGYEKRAVQVGGSDGEQVEILSGIAEGDNVVIQGVTFVKLAETKAVPEGHSHNH